MSGEVTMKSHSDMRQALAIGSFDYQNNVSLPYGFDLINTAEFSPNSNSLNTQIRKSIIHDLINIGLSCRYDEKGFNPVEIEASTGFSTKFRDTTFGIDTSIGFNSISMAPKIQFKLLEDAVLS